MANEFLKKIDTELKQKVRDKKQDAKDEIKTGLLSFMLENVANKIVKGFRELKLPTPQVKVDAPVVNVTVPDIKLPEINVPEVKIPQITVPEAKVTVELPKIPEIKIPTINVPAPQVTVNVEKPDTPIIPAIEMPDVVMPDEMKVTGGDKPLPVHMVDMKGDSVSMGGDNGGSKIVKAILQESKANIGKVDITNQQTAFNELSTSELSPVVQVQFPYNINTDIWEIRDNNGTASVVDNLANLSTGTSANQSSTILTRTPVKYNPGQGGLWRGTPLFDTAVVGNIQYSGIGNSTDGYFFGFEGTVFGVLRKHGGAPETRRLAITTASNTNENITITLNGVAEVVAVTATGGDTAANRVTTANEITAHDFSNVGEGWEVHNMGSSVFFTSFTDGAKTGTYSLVNGGGEAAGTFFQSLAGVSAIDTIIAQTAWSEDMMDGKGESGVILDPTKGNVYQIRYQWLGFGAVEYSIENPATGQFILVHRIEYANANTLPSVNNPTLPLCAMVKNTSNTSDVVLKVGSMMGGVEGKDILKGVPNSLSVETTGIGTTETPVLTIHSHDIYQGTLNRVKVKPIIATVSVEGTKNSIIRVTKNAVLTGPVAFTALNSNTSTIHRDTTATGISGGTVVFAESAQKVDTVSIDLEKLGIELNAPDFLTITVQATAAASIDSVATLNWQEQF